MIEDGATAMLITLNENVIEIEELARSLGVEILYEIIQRRQYGSRNTVVGTGKLDEIAEEISRRPVDIVLINSDLTPKQHYTLESILSRECVDRIRIVLEIFSRNAGSRQAKLQVERAMLEYEIPLIREWVHNAKTGEHPGFLSGGEYSTSVYYQYIRRRVRKIDMELSSLARDQRVQRNRRSIMGAHHVSIAGYTNTGKSSLLNALTEADVITDDRMFSTLSTTTRRLRRSRKEILVTDTIGFMGDLPHFLIESFRATIEGMLSADLVLLTIDSSEDQYTIQKKLKTSMEILNPEVGAEHIVLVLNKSDTHTGELPLIEYETVSVSALTGEGIEELRALIEERFHYDMPLHLSLPPSSKTQSLLSWLYDNVDVLSVDHGQSVLVDLLCRDRDETPIRQRTADAGGSVTVPMEMKGWG